MIDIVGGLLGTGDWSAWLQHPKAQLADLSNLYFFREINGFLQGEIDEFRQNLLSRTMAWVGSVALTLMTLWIMIQGYRIVTGQSRDSMMALVTNSLRSTLIVGLATGLALGGSSIYTFLTDDVSRAITQVVTGNDGDAYTSIDRSLGYMQLALGSIDHLQVGKDTIVEDAKGRAQWFTGIGIAGPAITGGAMLLLNKIAMALFIGLGPIFILCLLFEQTKQLFSKWLFYGLGTLFSLAVLSVMVALALDLVTAIAASFWVGKFLGANPEGVTSLALQQGGVGLILTMLIISAPPMAAQFFNGMLGGFQPYSQISGGITAPPPGHPSYPGPQQVQAWTAYGSGASPVQTEQRSTPGQESTFNNPATHAPSYVNQQDMIRTAITTQQGNAGTQQATSSQRTQSSGSLETGRTAISEPQKIGQRGLNSPESGSSAVGSRRPDDGTA